ncbi:hypothetical protein SFC07_11040 [Corynebacterium callunae]|uniref:phage tail termination protein n=1 Tax=Corynebacterium callunae TaxID=1721 RepID=UPI00398239F1
MVQIPQHLAERFADIEALVMNALTPALQQCSPPGRGVTALPDDASSTLDAGGFFVLITRVGGGIPPNQRARDDANIAVSVLSATRRDSWLVANMVRALFDDHRPGEAGIADIAEFVGPVQSPFVNPDRRLVTIYFTVTAVKTRRI